MKRSARMYKRSGSQFFRTTTGIKPGPDAFDVTEIRNFRLVIEGKTGSVILESSRLEFLEKFLVNNFALY